MPVRSRNAGIAASISALLLFSCGFPEKEPSELFGVGDLRRANRLLLEVAMEDGFSPPVAARVYMYPHLAHYITLQHYRPDSLLDISRKLHDWPAGLAPLDHQADPELAALLAFCGVAQAVVFSEHLIIQRADSLVQRATNAGFSTERIAASINAAEKIKAHMLPWMNSDGYVHTRTLDRFSSSTVPGHWVETSPDYTAALEPHWQDIRTMLIPNSAFHTVPALPPYSTTKGSTFHDMVSEVYVFSKDLADTSRAIALYWDDNPNITKHRGHLITQEHRISPPGHWLNIVGLVTEQQRTGLSSTTKLYTAAAIAMFDGVISCWNEKYRTDMVRPITYIQELIEPGWSSLIQTPPFPEYPSGHSVTSAAAATVLSNILGPDLAFTDSTEVLFGLGPRRFRSFQSAAWEVSLSRFYGGIHYRRSIEEGYLQGRAVGDLVANEFSASSKHPN